MTDMIQRYAAALYNLGQSDVPDLKQAAQQMLDQTELWKTLLSSAVTEETKEELIRSAAPLEGREPLQAFLCLLSQEGRLEQFPRILEEYRQLELAAQGGALCVMTCARQPSVETMQEIQKAVCKLRGLERVVLQVKIDPALLGGFILDVQGVTYDRSVRGRLDRLSRGMQESEAEGDDLSGMMDSLRETIQGFDCAIVGSETGRVLTLGDGIATVQGLDRAVYGELVEFENGVQGMVMDLSRDTVGCVLLGREDGLGEGSRVSRTGRPADVPVGEALLGRVVDAMGRPIDGLGPIFHSGKRPIEREASGVISREPVNVPLQTGILAIDSMVPIGRGQRELIIGDRQTGKTAIAVDTILNQKDQDVICIYVAIGQKASSVARVRDTLEKHGAMEYTIIVSATASDPVPLQYVAPYAGAAMGEYFMEQGRDVLIVYDDLSKHAVAYRALSLLLKRSPGREAYPGDVFYLHSRLLERACRLTEEYGGGSMTALPIIETQAGDVSAYIPTNVISITDGQIYLETDLFFSGQRPAVNVGLSVSRVGGAAQTKAVKKIAGSLRIDLAQFRELEVFTQFSSDLDASTKEQLQYGKSLMELLKQPLGSPLSLHEQVITLCAARHKILMDLDVKRVKPFQTELLRYFDSSYPEIGEEIENTGVLSDELEERIVSAAKQYAETQIR